MSDLLGIGASGVSAYQTALANTSENIANSGTAGYVRRTTTLQEVVVTSGRTSEPWRSGNGVTATGVARSTDPLKQAAVYSASADLARTETSSTWLDSIQSALTGSNLGDQLTSFYNSATTLAADPTSVASRSTMLEAATSVAASFTATGQALAQTATDLDSTANQAVSQLDQLATSLAKVNEGLARTASNSSAGAQLADQRDSIVEQMSALTDVNVATDDLGRATVHVGGASGPLLVSGTDAGTVSYNRNTSGAVALAVTFRGTTSALVANGGALAGVVEGAQQVQNATDALNTLASNFTTGVNTVQTGGDDLDGNAGTALFAVGDTPTAITVALTDPRGIAAASTGGGSRDNSNLAALQNNRTAGAYESTLTDLVSTNASQITQRATVADAQSAIKDGAVTARDAVSGVNLDTEAVDLLRFQQAYSASSRVIQVARETFQSIMDIN